MPPVSSCLIEILERQSFNDGIPAGLPAGARVAQRPARSPTCTTMPESFFAPMPFVPVIVVHGLADAKDSATLVADITRQLYRAMQ